ncbi:MAG: metallophosphoesterase [Candidatus Rehaiarchaeum fermentans]|nr:metallophosphoesterase [Candidatus Rehaiarchaeum fermentans]
MNSELLRIFNENDIIVSEDVELNDIDPFHLLKFLKENNISFVDSEVLERIKLELYNKNQNEFEVNSPQLSIFSGSAEEWSALLSDRYDRLRRILSSNYKIPVSAIGNLKEIGNVNVIGIIGEVKEKDGSFLFELEDPTGSVYCITTEEFLIRDAVVLVKGKFTGKFIMADEIVYPNSFKAERAKSNFEGYGAFISDIHVGSKLFAREEFSRFIKWINGEIEEYKEIASKIRYLFILGDAVDGVGVYPDQQEEIETTDVKSEYLMLANYLSKIRKDIKIFMIPGNHDSSHNALPQPPVSKEFAAPLYKIPNLILLYNPSFLTLKQPSIKVTLYHGNSIHYYVDNYPKFAKMTREDIASILKILLMTRHLAPSFGSAQVLPSKKDYLIIDEVPDILGIGDTHKAFITTYKNTIILNSGCWQYKTKYMAKFNIEPDLGKVPLVNLSDFDYTILDFSNERIKVFEEGINIKVK